MTKRDHPSVGRLAFYLIVAAAMTGAIAGWAYASGAVAWAEEDLRLPVWLIPLNLLSWLWIGKTLLMAYALWAAERFGRPGWRWAAVFSELTLFASSAGWVLGFLILRDPTYGFLAIAVSSFLTLVVVWVAGRATKLASVALWPVLVWTGYMFAVTFEVMRLNTNDIGQIALMPWG